MPTKTVEFPSTKYTQAKFNALMRGFCMSGTVDRVKKRMSIFAGHCAGFLLVHAREIAEPGETVVYEAKAGTVSIELRK